MSDISPRQPKIVEHAPEPKSKDKKRGRKSKAGHKPMFSLHLPDLHKHNVHKVGVQPLHFGAVLMFSLRTRGKPSLLALASLAAAAFAALAAYGAWLYLGGQLPRLSQLVTAQGQKVIWELVLFGALYYIGRSITQSAITYGVSRESDQRPVSLSRQFGVGINTFGRRLLLD